MFDGMVALHARLKPQSVAFVTPHGEIDYASFDADVDRFAAALLRWMEGGSPEVVHVAVGRQYVFWCVVLALARLGIPSSGRGSIDTPQWLVTDQTAARGVKMLLLDSSTSLSIFRAPRSFVNRRHVEGSRVGHILYSSGTTGRPKAIGMTWSAIGLQAKTYLQTYANRDTRGLACIGADTMFGFTAPLYVWAGGGAVIYNPGLANVPALLPTLKPTLMSMATGHLLWLLDNLPKDFKRLESARLIVGGSPVSQTLAARALETFVGEVTIVYGSTEAGGVAIGSSQMLVQTPDAVGYVRPEVEVEIVDGEGRRLGYDVEGEIRVRGAYVATQYYGDATASAKMFRGGWFRPGDLGQLSADGLLRVGGRVDEMINIDGVKFLPHAMEAAARACIGVRDVAIFSQSDREGRSVMIVAVVPSTGFRPKDLRAALVDVQPRAATSNLILVKEIARNQMGKVELRKLRAVSKPTI